MDHPEVVLSWLESARSYIDEATAALTPGRVEPQVAGFALARAIDTLDEAFNEWCAPESTRREPAPVVDLAQQRRVRRSGAGRQIGVLRPRRIPPSPDSALVERRPVASRSLSANVHRI